MSAITTPGPPSGQLSPTNFNPRYPASMTDQSSRCLDPTEDAEASEDTSENAELASLIAERRQVPEAELLTVEELAASVGKSHLLKSV